MTADTLYHTVTLTFGPLILNVCGTPGIKWLNYIPNMGEIEQSAAKLLMIYQVCARGFRRFLQVFQ